MKRTDKKRGALVTGGIILLVAVAIVTYIVKSASGIQTEDAVSIQVTDYIDTTGYVVRDENYILSTRDGIVAYDIDDGEKINQGGVVGSVFQTEKDALNHKKIREIEEEIENFERLNQTNVNVQIGLDSVNNQLDSRLLQFQEDLNNNRFKSMDTNVSELMYLINQKLILTGKVENFDAEIQDLQQEKEKLESETAQSLYTITSNYSGYFVSTCDGYENILSYDDIENVTLDDYNNVGTAANVPDSAIGKVIHSLNWYVVCPVTADQAFSLSNGSTNVTIKMPYAFSGDIPAKVVKVNQESDQSDGVVILQCSYMDADLSKIRAETVQIGLNTYEGIRVSKDALHNDYVTYTYEDESGNTVEEQKLVQGVYVKYGSKLIFKQVSILYAGNDFVICDTSPEEGVLYNGQTVELYDQIVVSGGNLYDGKIVD